jgi:hypothetical protein
MHSHSYPTAYPFGIEKVLELLVVLGRYATVLVESKYIVEEVVVPET